MNNILYFLIAKKEKKLVHDIEVMKIIAVSIIEVEYYKPSNIK